MDCIDCGSDKNIGIFIYDRYKKTSYINYICINCGRVWNSDDLDLDVEINKSENNNSLMSDYMPKCLMCNASSYEKEKNLWHCPECSFEWETINVDKEL